MDDLDFSQKCPGHLVRVSDAHCAFVPDPLPPDLPLTLGLLHAIDESRGIVGELAGLTRTLPNPYIFIRPFQRQEAVASSRIEGTEADLWDLYYYEAGQGKLLDTDSAQSTSEIKEVQNYVLALDYGLARVQELPVSVRLIREIHERLLAGVRGESAAPGNLRVIQNWIGPRRCAISEARCVPPPPAGCGRRASVMGTVCKLHRRSTPPRASRTAALPIRGHPSVS